MKKYAVAFTVFFILLIPIFLILMHNGHNENQVPGIILDAFNTTGARIVSSELYLRGKFDTEKYVGQEVHLGMLRELIAAAGGHVDGDLPVSVIDTDIASGMEAEYILNENSRILISILKEKQSDKPEKYNLLVSVTDTSARPAVPETISGLKTALDKYNINPDVNISITGSLDGKLDDSDIEILFDKVFRKMGANKAEGIKDSGLISVTAFSPYIKNSIRVNGRHVNVNIAARYNSYEDKTYIWLATPVITTEY